MMSADTARRIIDRFEKHGTDLVVDFEHATIRNDAGIKPAAGWIKALRYTIGEGIKGLVRWCSDAAQMINSGRYRYLSPVLVHDDQGGSIEALHSVGLTNRPAINNFPPLTAFSRDVDLEGFMSMPRTVVNQSDPTSDGFTRSVDALRNLLELPEDATPYEVLSGAVNRLESLGQSSDPPTTSQQPQSLRRELIRQASIFYDATHNASLRLISSRRAFTNYCLRCANQSPINESERTMIG